MWAGLQSEVDKVNSSELSTHLCAEPVLSSRVGERWGPSLTLWGWFVRKSLIQDQELWDYNNNNKTF